MHGVWFSLAWAALFCYETYGYFQNGEFWDSPEEANLYPFVVALEKRAPEFVDRILVDENIPHWTPEWKEKLATSVAAIRAELTLTEACNSCRLTVGTVQLLVRAGASYEDLFNATMEICYDLVSGEGYDPDMLCESALDVYAPHVIDILNITTKTPFEICFQYNSCLPGDEVLTTEAPPARADRAPFPAKKRNKPRAIKKHDLEDALRVLHITDIHVDEFYTQGSASSCSMPLCCRTYWPGEGEAMRWGDYDCNIPYETMDAYFSWLSQLDPELIIYTGDSPPHTVWMETQSGQLNVSEAVAGYIKHYFPGIPAYTTIGNHDMYPTNLYYTPREEIQEVNSELRKYWQDLSLFGEKQIETFDEAGYFSILNRPGLRIMGYNTNYGATDNFYNILNDETAPEMLNMRAYMESELNQARVNGEKVIFIGHHATGSGGSMNYEGRFITNLLASYGDVIVFYLLGHNHGDEIRLIRDEESGEAKAVALSSPSMTSKTNINPAARMFYLDRDTFTPLDSDVFFVDLNQNGNSEELMVELMYRSSAEYGMPDLTAASYEDLIVRLQEDEALMTQFSYNRGTRTSPPSPCTGTCMRNTICYCTNTVYELYRRCIDTWPEAL